MEFQACWLGYPAWRLKAVSHETKSEPPTNPNKEIPTSNKSVCLHTSLSSVAQVTNVNKNICQSCKQLSDTINMAPTSTSKIALFLSFAGCLSSIRKLRSFKKKDWVRSWLQRKEKSVYRNLVRELSLEDQSTFEKFHRMDKELFCKLLELVAPRITKLDTTMRKAVTASERLSVTLRHLATGKLIRHLMYFGY